MARGSGYARPIMDERRMHDRAHASLPDELDRLRGLSSTAIARQPDALIALARGLADARTEVCERAAAVVRVMVVSHRLRPQHTKNGFPEPARAALLTALGRGVTEEARALAAQALCEAEQVSAMPAFIAGLADPAAMVRDACVRALRGFSWTPAHAPALAPLVVHAEADVRAAALSAVPGHADRRLIGLLEPQLIACLGHPSADVRVRAAHLLEAVDSPPPEIWPVLLETLAAGSAEQRSSALRRIEGAADPAFLEPVLAAAGDPDASVSGHALTALGELARSDPRVIATLVGALADARLEPRRAAARALGHAAAASAVPALAAIVDRAASVAAAHPQTAAQVEAAIEALGGMGHAALAAAPALGRALAHPSDELRLAAAMALVNMAADTPALRTTLAELCARGDEWTREVAAGLAAALDSDPAAALETRARCRLGLRTTIRR